ncbi:MAG: O-antigen ligase family protein [Gaiellaceae bacterium]
MGTVAALLVYAVLLAAAAAAVWRRQVIALYLFVVGLAAHNATMAALYAAGLRGGPLTAVTAWKEILLAMALISSGTAAFRERRLPFRPGPVDGLALAFAAVVVVYALIPQSALDGAAGRHAVALGARHDLVPVGAYFLGRSLRLDAAQLRRLAWTVLGTAAVVAGAGLVDVYALPIGWWRSNGVADYFHRQLGYDYHGTGGLPENFIYNVGGDRPFLRRLVSTFLSPLASGYLCVVALLLTVSGLRGRIAIPLALGAAVGLLFTFSRSSLVALAAGFVVLAAARRQPLPLACAALTIGIAVAWVHVFPKIAPTGRFTKADLVVQHERGKQNPTANPDSPGSTNEPSIRSHLASLRDGFSTMVDHPEGYGLGNVGQTASRTGTPLKAGESNYTELGVELGILGAVIWTGWGLGLVAGLLRAGAAGDPWAAGFAAALAAILVLAIQTDVIGDPWVAYCMWALGGALVAPAAARAPTMAGARAAAVEQA